MIGHRLGDDLRQESGIADGLQAVFFDILIGIHVVEEDLLKDLLRHRAVHRTFIGQIHQTRQVRGRERKIRRILLFFL